jgi:hypothetical protein
MPGLRYSQERQAEAVGLALAVGPSEAMRRTGIPKRTIERWLADRPPAVQAVITASRQDVRDKLWEAVTVGTEAVLTGLRDPKARLSDKATALRIVSEQYALLSGSPTAINANLNVNAEARELTWDEKEDLRRWLDEVEQADDEALEAAAARYRLIVAGRPELLEKANGD